MAIIINDPNSGSIFGRLGNSLGQGIAQQAPKIAEQIQEQARNKQLAKGIKSIGDKPGNQVENLSKLVGLPGGKEILPHAMPFLQNLRKQQEFQRNQEELSNGVENSASVLGTPENTGEMPLGRNERGRDFLERATDEQINERARQLYRESPARFGDDPELARLEARAEDDRRIAGDVQFQEKQDRAAQKYDKASTTLLQKDNVGKFADIAGTLDEKLRNKLRTDVAFGKNEDQAASKYSKEALGLAKAFRSLQDMGAKSVFRSNPSDNRNNLSATRNVFKESNGLEEYSDLLEGTQGLTTHYARNLAFPLEDNKELSKVINAEKGRPGGRGVGSREKESKLAEAISKVIKPTDSLFTIGLKADRKGLDDRALIEYLRMIDEDQDILNARQKDELTKYRPVSPNLSDLWLYSLSGLED